MLPSTTVAFGNAPIDSVDPVATPTLRVGPAPSPITAPGYGWLMHVAAASRLFPSLLGFIFKISGAREKQHGCEHGWRMYVSHCCVDVVPVTWGLFSCFQYFKITGRKKQHGCKCNGPSYRPTVTWICFRRFGSTSARNVDVCAMDLVIITPLIISPTTYRRPLNRVMYTWPTDACTNRTESKTKNG